MRSAGVREARQNLSALLDEVRKGQEIVITERGRPVAKLVPPDRPRGKGVPNLAGFRRKRPVVHPPCPARAARACRTSLRSGGRCPCSIPRSPATSRRIVRTASNPRRTVREQRGAYRVSLPGPLYCDTSALLKLYLPEAGSDVFNALVEGRDDLLVSDLCVTEAASALARRVRGGGLPQDAARRGQLAILARGDEGAYHRVELTRDVHRRAEHFLLSL